MREKRGMAGRERRKPDHAARVLISFFLLVIFLGSVLLSLPVSSRNGESCGAMTAVFTATSATCVTGLSLVDSYSQWSAFGQVVLLGLIQIGGLGYMAFVSVFYFLLRRRIGLRERLVLQQAMALDELKGVVRLVRLMLAGTFLVEGTGALILTLRFLMEYPLKKALWPGSTLFEDMGFTYLGPIDGHDLDRLVHVLAWARELQCPVVVHVKTVKGRGYSFAEQNPDKFHGVGPFDPETGLVKKSGGDDFSAVFGRTLAACAAMTVSIVRLAEPVVSFLSELRQLAGLEPALLQPLLRTVGIGLLTPSVCADAGESTVARLIELCGSVLGIYTALPLLEAVLSLLRTMLEG